MSIKNALIVDDSRSAQIMLKRLLNKIHIESKVVDCAEDALAFLETHTPDIIFMDHMMPGIDGLEATSRIKANPRTADIPTIMYTSKDDADYQVQARNCGAQGVLPKPADHEAVMAVIEQFNTPAANDELKQDLLSKANIERWVEQLIQGQIVQARAQINAGLDTSTQQIQMQLDHQLQCVQQDIEQRFTALIQELPQPLTQEQLWSDLRPSIQRLSLTVAEKLDQKWQQQLRNDYSKQLEHQRSQFLAEIAQFRVAQRRSWLKAILVATLLGSLSGALLSWLITIQF